MYVTAHGRVLPCCIAPFSMRGYDAFTLADDVSGLLDRLDGYRAAMDEADVAVDPELVRYGNFHVQDGIVEGRALLSLARAPTAIFAGNDLQALGVYQAAREARLHIPEDLSVVGFDDLPVAKWVGPPLTTVRQPLVQMAVAGARLALRLARGEQPSQTRVELATELVIRESSASPNR